MFGIFKQKKEIEDIKKEVKGSFNVVKKDIDKINSWVNYLNNQDESIKNNISEKNNEIKLLKEDISNIKDELEQLKNVLSLFNEGISKQVFKQTTNKLNTCLNKQTPVYDVQTSVQTSVQTDNFIKISNLSITERAIISILLNSDLKLSYEDLATMLGKTKSTIRGQINSIKQKSEGLIKEYMELNGKKRVFISEEIKEKLLKNVKVRVKNEIKEVKSEEREVKTKKRGQK